ncbi:MAG: CoA-acylating methylmalonate-semialdehyde dehydrogenase [Anaerolineae bacterium]|nr:CoA-acylating methylmalonate-semialdehyde dehydrogenase [Anaerolineae bacterium]MDW8100409.1 CoA-acylating methylmalonate-semialdehyde dehydrogenase [Anaerolineae bacterium]
MNRIPNLVQGEWTTSRTARWQDVHNPATGEVLAQVPLSTAEEVDAAITAAQEAFEDWRRTPPLARARILFRFKNLLEEHFEELARSVTLENGKTLDEARGEVRRAIENVETAVGVPSLMLGTMAEDISEGIDEEMIRQPLGVCTMFAPFNFPAMVPLWFVPYALATGNTYVLKPSDRCPLTQNRIAELLLEAGIPEGVYNVVHGGADVARQLMEDPRVRAVSFVGSTPVAREVYRISAAAGKRVQCQGGAKNALVVMPDAPLDRTVPAIITSAFGNAGQRCLAGSLVLAVGDIHRPLVEQLVERAAALRVGNGLDEQTQMGPVISPQAKARILNYIERGIAQGARLVLDGRGVYVPGGEDGFFVGPTIFDEVTPDMDIARDEIFGPVLSVISVPDLDAAIDVIERSRYGNMACIFTESGRAAREFKYRVPVGNVGVNIGVAAPIAFFPFGGMKDSFFGDLHGQGQDAVDFFTHKKVVITRWF